jgi:hypothetical protein
MTKFLLNTCTRRMRANGESLVAMAAESARCVVRTESPVLARSSTVLFTAMCA